MNSSLNTVDDDCFSVKFISQYSDDDVFSVNSSLNTVMMMFFSEFISQYSDDDYVFH